MNEVEIKNRKLIRFIAVGAAGFAMDAFILTALVRSDLGIFFARMTSFIVASAATWVLNRKFTFQRAKAALGAEYMRYVVIQAGGATLNLLIFLVALWEWPLLHHWLVIPLFIGAIGGLMFNYVFCGLWVFRG